MTEPKKRSRRPPLGETARDLEKNVREIIDYLNEEVVPVARTHSTRALRVAARKLSALADYMEEHKK